MTLTPHNLSRAAKTAQDLAPTCAGRRQILALRARMKSPEPNSLPHSSRSPPVEKSGAAAEDPAERGFRVGGRVAQQVEQTGFSFSGIDRAGGAVDAGQLRRGGNRVVEIAD